MKTILSILKRHFDDAPDKIFCRFAVDGNIENISYKKLVEKSFSYAEHFKNKGVSKGEPVIIMLRHSPHLFYSFLGAMAIGAIPSILPFPSDKQDINLHRDSIEKLSKRIGAKSIITYKENLIEVEKISKDLEIDSAAPEDINGSGRIDWGCKIDENDIAFLQHSSGTTGLKKGVALSHKSAINQVETYSDSINLNKDDVIISWLPLYHDMGLIACFILPLIKKAPLVMIDPFEWVVNPKILFEQIEKNKGTLCWLPNFAFNFLVTCVDSNAEKYNLSSMRAFINCSEPCKLHSFEIFYNHFKGNGVKIESLQTCYAMAENVFAITQSEIGKEIKVDYVDKESLTRNHFAEKSEKNSENAISFLSVGKTIPNNEIRIVDSNRRELGERKVGEIKVASNSLFSGYFKLPEESSKVIEGKWFYTGDLGYIADSELYITGRKKDLIIVHGRNYYAHDIEHIANYIDGVKKGRCVAIGVYNDDIGSEEVVLIAETEALEEGTRSRIIKEIKKRISEDLSLNLREVYLVPLRWLIKTTSGKISRIENKNKYLKEKNSGVGYN